MKLLGQEAKELAQNGGQRLNPRNYDFKLNQNVLGSNGGGFEVNYNPKNSSAKSTISDDVSYYRVQGGTAPKRSKDLIHVDDSGNIDIKNETLNISKGSTEHAEHFLKSRPGAQVIEFKIPRWLDEFIEQTAIPQAGYKTNSMNQGGLAPKIVDPTTPGTSYELPSVWSKWLQENAIPNSGSVRK